MIGVPEGSSLDVAGDIDVPETPADARPSPARHRSARLRRKRLRPTHLAAAGMFALLVTATLVGASFTGSGKTTQEPAAAAVTPRGPAAPPTQIAGDAVLNCSLITSLSGWRASSDTGHVELTRVATPPTPVGETTAADVVASSPTGKWAMVLISLRQPGDYFQVGSTYRMQLWVRDVTASGANLILVLANQNYRAQPSTASMGSAHKDTEWHLVSRTFVATAPGGDDTALYVQLPADQAFHYQLTGASVSPVVVPGVPHVDGPPAQVVSFDGPAGSPPNPAQWNREVGGNGWGNGELETYTRSVSNAQLDGSGHLVITARRETKTGPDGIRRDYTSARINTLGKVVVQPGSYVESTIDVPVGGGVWSAFWLIGSNFPQVGWPASGELNVMEVAGADTTWVHTAAHMAEIGNPRALAEFGWGDAGGSTDLGPDLRARTHSYGVYFDGQTVRFYIDRKEHMAVWAQDATAAGWDWPFGKPESLVLNIAVGAGDPANTTFPQTMTVGPISVWQGGTPF
ncbi:family 16 glycosylhydrolase [Pseudofrankia sp. DC12]|uniref:family 16 glycosylhydrolase n=1 Tax=Pseudofrankia sp. DC12 TaxID=683315 RepID=UPI0005F804F3|nr:family 16 glycosylhydrolase [Pseudofrankia sp. DC12]